MFTEDDMLMMSPEEADIARQANAAEQAGRDPTEDVAEAPQDEAAETTTEEATDEASENTPQQEATEATAEDAKPAEDEAQPEAEEAAPAPVITPPTYNVDTGRIDALQTERKSLRTKLAQLDADYAAGEVSDEDLTARKVELQEAIDTINGHISTIQTLEAANQQSIAAAQKAVLDVIRAQGKRAGIDYSTPTLMAQFNAVLDGLDADPANAGLTFAEMADKAHTAVLAINGKAAAPAPAPTSSKEPPKRETPPPPKTLRAMPSAERALENFGGAVTDQIFAGNAVDAEAAWERLTPKQREAVLRGQ